MAKLESWAEAARLARAVSERREAARRALAEREAATQAHLAGEAALQEASIDKLLTRTCQVTFLVWAGLAVRNLLRGTPRNR